MHSFRNDYSEGAHPAILEALTETNLTQTVGYGLDPTARLRRIPSAASPPRRRPTSTSWWAAPR